MFMQFTPAVAMGPDGRSWVAYAEASDGPNERLYVQRISADVARVGDRIPFGLGERTTDPAIAMAPDGRFVVCYRAYLGAGALRILCQRFHADGSPAGPPIPVVEAVACSLENPEACEACQ